jgi:hypothetical protein
VAYSVRCGCGKVHSVVTGQAGSRIGCTCGREVEVPSLSVLRREAGESSASPELVIESMLNAGELPQESRCVECHTITNDVAYFSVVCESTELKKPHGGCSLASFFILWSWIGLLFGALRNEAESRVVGRNVSFRLPLRVCPICKEKSRTAVKELLCRVPVYAHLLSKYPHATITPAQ